MIRALLLLVGAAHAAQDCPCEPCVEGVGMRDNASWGFYRLSDVYAHTLSSYNACFWPRSLACDYSNKRTHLSDLDAFLAAVREAPRANTGSAAGGRRGRLAFETGRYGGLRRRV